MLLEATPEESGSELVTESEAVEDLTGSTLEDELPEELDQTAAPEEATAEPEEGETPAEPEDKYRSLREFVDKTYDGNVDEFLRGIRESWSSQSRLAKELAEIKERLTAGEKSPTPSETDPDIAWFTEEIKGIDAEISGYQQSATGIIQEMAKNRQDLAALEGELRRADEYDRRELLRQKRDMERDQKLLEQDYKTLQRDAKIAVSRRKELELRQKAVEREVSARNRLKLQEDEQKKSAQSQIVTSFDDAVAEEAKAAGITGRAQTYLSSVIRSELVTYLRSLPEGSPGVDIPAFVKARAQEFLSAHQEISRNRVRGLKKPVPASPTTPTGKPVAKPAAPVGKISAEDVRARAARLLP